MCVCITITTTTQATAMPWHRAIATANTRAKVDFYRVAITIKESIILFICGKGSQWKDRYPLGKLKLWQRQ